VGTFFLPYPGLSGKRRWIAFATTVRAALVVNAGATRALTGGKEAQGEVTIEVEHNGARFRARGLSTDIVEASAKAYLAAVNRVLSGR
jgi:glutamate 5-kinase